MTGFLLTPLTSGATTPAQAGFAPGTNTVDLRARVSRVNWGDTTNLGAFLANWSSTAANSRYMLSAGTGGTLIAQWYNAAGALQTCTSTANLAGLASGSIKWVRALITPSAGTCSFFTSDDNVTYTQLGTTITGKTTTAVQTPTTAQPLTVAVDASAANGMLMHVYAAQLRINSALIVNMDWTPLSTPVTGTWTSATGEVWTRVGLSTLNIEDAGTNISVIVTGSGAQKIADSGTTTFTINPAAIVGITSPALDTTGYQDAIDGGNVRANRMLDAIPPYYRNDPTVRGYFGAWAKELDRFEAAAQALRSGAFPATASERTLEYYERLFLITTTGLSTADRQANVAAHMRRRRVAQRYDWQQALLAFIGSADWSYSEGPHDTYTVNLTLPPDPTTVAVTTAFAREITPAHLNIAVNGSYGGFLVGVSRIGIDPL